MAHALDEWIRDYPSQLRRQFNQDLTNEVVRRFESSNVRSKIHDIFLEKDPDAIVSICNDLAAQLILTVSWLDPTILGTIDNASVARLVEDGLLPLRLKASAEWMLSSPAIVHATLRDARLACNHLGNILAWTTESAGAVFDMFVEANPIGTGFRVELATTMDIKDIVGLDHVAFDEQYWIDDETFVKWSNGCPETFYVIRNPIGRVIAYYSAFFLRDDIRAKFIKGELNETDFEPEHLIGDVPAANGYEYLLFFSIVVGRFRSHTLFPRFMAAVLCLHGVERLRRVLTERAARRPHGSCFITLFAYPATPPGRRIISFAGLAPEPAWAGGAIRDLAGLQPLAAVQQKPGHEFMRRDFSTEKEVTEYATLFRRYGLTGRSSARRLARLFGE